MELVKTGADLEGGAPGARPLFALICKTKKMRPPVQPDKLYCCAQGFDIFSIRAWKILM